MITKRLSRGFFGRARRPGCRTRAFSLVEVVMALAVASFCLLTLLALVPVGLQVNRLSRQESIAYDLCGNIESDLKAATTNATSPLYGITMPTTTATTATLYDAYNAGLVTFSNTPSSMSQYRFTITLTPPATSSPNDPILANIVATWPPQINPATGNTTDKVSVCVTINHVGS